MAPRKPKIPKDQNVTPPAPPEPRSNIHAATVMMINDLLADCTMDSVSFPSSFSSADRKYVHRYALKLGLKSKSDGVDPNRVLTVFKVRQEKNKSVHLDVGERTERLMYQLMKRQPVAKDNNFDGRQKWGKKRLAPYRISVGTLNHPQICVPSHPANTTPEVAQTRMNLPIYPYRTQLIQMIHENHAVVVSGETGSGKTTQVPQYILEHCSDNNLPCRIICAQPRRLSAISVAERVCYERGEQVGHTVGFQIRFESKTSPTSNLIYCTNGILLRCLMGSKPEDVFKDITHVIVDEVHERDKYSDFLLISLRRAVLTNPKLRIVLMSATIDCELFAGYLSCPTIEIPGKIHPVDVFYLEDVLMELKFRNKRIEETIASDADFHDTKSAASCLLAAIGGDDDASEQKDEEMTKLLDEMIQNCFLNGDEDSSSQFLYLVEGEEADINYKHSETDISALMAGAAKGMLDFVDNLLNMGADPALRSSQGFTALDLAVRCEQTECVDRIQLALDSAKPEMSKKDKMKVEKMENILLEGYLAEHGNEDIDHALVCALIRHIHTTKGDGAILVFFPGFAEIVEQAEKIEETLDASEFQLFMLHSQMETKSQRSVFSRMPRGVRKIILSTNIAETSVTIDDVVYVIDVGLVKQQTFDAFSGSSCLAVSQISRACAKQRQGRAGRCQPGVCYRMYAKDKFNQMSEYTLPELLRVPLTEICVQSKLIAPDMRVEDFLKLAIQPPSSMNIEQSIQILEAIGAMDSTESLTELGILLGDIPLDVRLGKMLIFSIFLRCLDPILTIVSSLSASSPFIIPSNPQDRGKVARIKNEWSEGAFSDHLVLLRLFQKWSEQRLTRSDKVFCRNNFIRSGTMDSIAGIRSQLLGQLRSIGLVRNTGPGHIHELNANSHTWSVVKACLVAGLYPNVAYANRTKGTMESSAVKRLGIQKSSVLRPPVFNKNDTLSHLPTEWVVFEEKVRISHHLLAQTSTSVTPFTVALLAGPSKMIEEEHMFEEERAPDARTYKFKVDNWLEFFTESENVYLLFHFRQKLNMHLQIFLNNPKNFFHNNRSADIIQTMVAVLEEEENRFKYPQLKGVGEPPRAIGLYIPATPTNGTATSNPPVRNTPPQRLSYNNSPSEKPLREVNTTSWRQQNMPPTNWRDPQTRQPNPAHTPRNYAPPKQRNAVVPLAGGPQRLFVVKAASREQVLLTVRANSWTFSSNVRTELNRMHFQSPRGTQMFILFYVPLQNCFCCLTEYEFERKYFNMRIVTEKTVSTQTVQELFNKIGVRKVVEEFCDGEEVPREVSSFLFQMLAY